MATLTVGPGQQYSTISSAVAASRDGDILQVQAGTYTNDFATINTKITLQGVGGMVKMVATGNIANGKGILVTNTDVTIDNFEFSGAQVADANGAGIRYQGGNLTITDSYFHDNQNGILANPVSTGTITIRNSEFDHNGVGGDGHTHNIYVNQIAKLTIDGSLFHDAVIGHQIKSRAVETVITNNRIYDESGTSSYSIDLPNGGKATISGNVIQQGPNGDNPNIIAYGAEGIQHSVNSATISNNIVLNDMGRGAFILNASGSPIAVTGTQTWNVATMVNGSGVTVSGTTPLASEPVLDLSAPWAAGTTTPAPVPTTPQSLTGGAGADTLLGGTAADTLSGGDGANLLRGGEGADAITGGAGFDNINGNQGADTINSGAGADWALGGQGEDIVSAGAGADIVNGNIGQDTVDGGDGADTIRGGQGDDVITGGAGNDWISGDLGSDTISGGLGADTFRGFEGGGADRVADFNYAEGDRVALDHGTTYTAAQVGADVVITMNGATMTLANVTLTSLPAGWIMA